MERVTEPITGMRAVVDPACATCHGTGQVNGNPCGPCSLLLTPSEIAFLYGKKVPDAPAQP
ncbi:hypothetical protein LI90_3572 [Carbonactinospora thermoautotrophica]|uniref:Uncharacterized protein n=1 Tax=Carbonactinospora thermoautotrophica TaxID=1469144 RepID=A0A132MNY6_9ACTN|nr:hypothetical protein LI90_1213 [Carbonactinospora thermoautotrophica]KWX02529.1 hypothetical protein LI90_3572 [Carbonactinospora thermoautotrophica]